jgi:hypothetical protein
VEGVAYSLAGGAAGGDRRLMHERALWRSIFGLRADSQEGAALLSLLSPVL